MTLVSHSIIIYFKYNAKSNIIHLNKQRPKVAKKEKFTGKIMPAINVVGGVG